MSHKLTEKLMQEAIDWIHHSGSERKASRDSGINRTTLQHRAKRGYEQGMTPTNDDPREERLSPEQIKEADTMGIPASQLSHGWSKTDQGSFFFKVPRPEEDVVNIADAVVQGMRDVPRHTPHLHVEGDCNGIAAVFPIADLHMGMLADIEETGEDWDSKIALGVFESTFGKLMNLTPRGEEAVILNLGDLLHTNDQSNTTKSGHQLDTDSRFFQTLRRGVAAMKFAIELALGRYDKVTVRNQRGNHDEMAVYAVTLALGEFYADNPRVNIIQSATEFFVWEWGNVMLLAAHGDKTSAERLVMMAAAEHPEVWARTSFRMALTGHIHHQTRKEYAGMVVESLGSIIPKDAYAHSHAYSAMRSLVSIVFEEGQGEVARFRVGV